MDMMPLSVFIDIPRCYNKELVSVGTHLNFYYIHDSFFPFLLLFFLIAGGIVRHMSISMFICYCPGNQSVGIQKRNSYSANRSNAETMKY
jgi:hypothetical protein